MTTYYCVVGYNPEHDHEGNWKFVVASNGIDRISITTSHAQAVKWLTDWARTGYIYRLVVITDEEFEV